MRGIIMEIKENKAVILCNDGSFKVIKNRNFTIGQEIDMPKPQYNTLTAIAACLLLFIGISSSWYSLCKTPSSYVYLDINPSIRLDINYFEKIISVVPLNDDAAKLMSEYSFDKKKTEECINDIVVACREMKYINENNNDIDIEVVTAKSALVENVNVVSDKLKNDNMVVSVSTVSKSDNKRAMKLNISVQKLKAVEAYTNTFGGNVSDNAEELKKMPVKEIYKEINKHDFTDSVDAGNTLSDNAAENTDKNVNHNNASTSDDFQPKPKSESKKPIQLEHDKKVDSDTNIDAAKSPKPWRSDKQIQASANKSESKKDRTDNTSASSVDKKNNNPIIDNAIDKKPDINDNQPTFKADNDSSKDEKNDASSDNVDKNSILPSNNSNSSISSDKNNDASNNKNNSNKKNDTSDNNDEKNSYSDKTVDDNTNNGDNKKPDTQPNEQSENKNNDNDSVKGNAAPSVPKEDNKPSDNLNSDKPSQPNRPSKNPENSNSGTLLNSSPSKNDTHEKHEAPSAPEKIETKKNDALGNGSSTQNNTNSKPKNPNSSDGNVSTQGSQNSDSKPSGSDNNAKPSNNISPSRPTDGNSSSQGSQNTDSKPSSPSKPANSSKNDAPLESKRTERNTADKASPDKGKGDTPDKHDRNDGTAPRK